MKITKRIKEIADMIPKSQTIVDVGCDHGLLGIYLLKEEKCKHVIDTDISKHAIESAKKNAQKYHVEDKISFFVADGLSTVPYKKEDTIVITGMGAHTMVKILKKEADLQTLVVSAQKSIPYLRSEAIKMGYKIADEKAILDKKWYIIMRLEKGKVNYEEIDYLLGPFAKKNKEYREYIYQKEKMISQKKKKKTELLLLFEKQKNL